MDQSTASLRRSLVIQSRVVGALLMREVLTRYGRHNIGFLWLFVEPMLFTLGITALWAATRSVHGLNLPIVAFAITGYSSVLLWRNMPSRCMGAIEPNLALMHHRNVKILDVFAARILLEVAGATTSFAMLALLFTSIGWMELPENVGLVLLGWVMLAWFGAALALVIGALSGRTEIVDKLWHPASYLLFPLSGAAFMVDWLPPGARDAILFLPMVHGVELLREGYFGSAVHAHYSFGYLFVSCVALTLVGLAQTRVLSGRIVPE